jgi:hypothetical protein
VGELLPSVAVNAPGPAPGLEQSPALWQLLLTQWMAGFIMFEALVATRDRKGRIPTLGL